MRKANDRIPNFRHLRVFVEVARQGAISVAAERIHLSQPAISQALAKLEEGVGAKLFERHSEGMTVTEAGRRLVARVELALELVAEGAREASRLSGRKGVRAFPDFDRLLTTPQLRALVAVSGAGNFSLAAQRAGVSQPALRRAVRDLERLSGITLFVKGTSGIEPTTAARALNQSIMLAFAELHQGFDEVNAALGIDHGEIVIGAMPLPRAFVLPMAINALMEVCPDVRIKVIDGPYDDLLHGLRHGDLDLLIGALRHPLPIDDIVQEELFMDPLAVVGRVGHPLTGLSAITVADLTAFSWVVPRQGTPTRTYFDQMFRGLAVKGGLVETSSQVLIRGLLAGSDRLTLISVNQVRHELEMGVLTSLPIDTSGASRPIGITYRRNWRPTETQGLFLDRLRAAGLRAGVE